MLRARVFASDGRRFLVPGFWYDDDPPGMGDHTRVMVESLMLTTVLDLDTSVEWFDLPVGAEGAEGRSIALVYVEATICHPALRHGSLKVLLISGPEFDVAESSGHLTSPSSNSVH